MPGTVKLFVGPIPVQIRDSRYYNIYDRRGIIKFWKEHYEDAVIQILPDHNRKIKNKERLLCLLLLRMPRKKKKPGWKPRPIKLTL